jgi:hypothetical protein
MAGEVPDLAFRVSFFLQSGEVENFEVLLARRGRRVRVSCSCALRGRAAPLRLLALFRPPINRSVTAVRVSISSAGIKPQVCRCRAGARSALPPGMSLDGQQNPGKP